MIVVDRHGFVLRTVSLFHDLWVVMEIIIWATCSSTTTWMNLGLNCHCVGSVYWLFTNTRVGFKDILHSVVKKIMRIVKKKAFAAIRWTRWRKRWPHWINKDSVIWQGSVTDCFRGRSCVKSILEFGNYYVFRLCQTLIYLCRFVVGRVQVEWFRVRAGSGAFRKKRAIIQTVLFRLDCQISLLVIRRRDVVTAMLNENIEALCLLIFGCIINRTLSVLI